MEKIFSKSELIKKAKNTFERFGAQVVYATPDGNIFVDKQRAQEHDRKNVIEITAKEALGAQRPENKTKNTVAPKADDLQEKDNIEATEVASEEVEGTPPAPKKKVTKAKK